MTHVLNLMVQFVDLQPSYVTPNNQVWVVIAVDGSSAPGSTPAVPMLPHSAFNSPMQFKFLLQDPTRQYVYLTFCCFGATPQQMIPIARAKVRIVNMPLNNVPFQLPLIAPMPSKAGQVANISLVGSINPPLVKVPQPIPNAPPYNQPSSVPSSPPIQPYPQNAYQPQMPAPYQQPLPPNPYHQSAPITPGVPNQYQQNPPTDANPQDFQSSIGDKYFF